MPVWEDLEGAWFPERRALVNALRSRSRAMARGEPQLTGMDRILIAPSAYYRWSEMALAAARGLPAECDPSQIPDERCEHMPDGRLRIFVEVQGVVLAEMMVTPEEWSWRDH